MVQQSMIRTAVFGGMVLVLACSEGPVAAGPESAGGSPIQPTRSVDPVTRVRLTMTDRFVAPLIREATGAGMARQIAAVFATRDRSRSGQHVELALDALARLRASLRGESGDSRKDMMASDGAVGDAEALLVQDVLGLVVDDAIESLLAASSDASSAS